MRVYELKQPNGLDSWSLAERPIPKPERGQVLVKIRAVSLNYTDILIATARYGSAPLPATLIPVSDGAGEVVEVGSEVSRFTTGARVAGIFSQSWLGGSQVDDAWNTALGGAVDGVLAEYQVFDQNGVVRIPNHVSYEEGDITLRRCHGMERPLRSEASAAGANRAHARHGWRVCLCDSVRACRRREGAGDFLER
jgi:NADPH:quinone reductase-like Zn-dependent oxidoreductase